MANITEKIKMASVKDLTPYPNNPRKNEAAIEPVANSIREFGFKQPIVIDKDNTIIAGHTRLKAAKQLGMTEVPVIVADDLTPEQVKAYRLADNKTGELAAWDFDKLDVELGDIDIDMEQFGFSFGDDDKGPADDIYTMKRDIPQYEPTGEKVSLLQCVDTAKYDELIEEINASKVTEDEKKFLRLAAIRHCVFDYSKIADFYAASASKEMQTLMENSALVIIDYNNAIKNGYAVLRQTLIDLVEDDNEE